MSTCMNIYNVLRYNVQHSVLRFYVVRNIYNVLRSIYNVLRLILIQYNTSYETQFATDI